MRWDYRESEWKTAGKRKVELQGCLVRVEEGGMRAMHEFLFALESEIMFLHMVAEPKGYEKITGTRTREIVQVLRNLPVHNPGSILAPYMVPKSSVI